MGHTNRSTKNVVLVGDMTHTAKGIAALTFPLGASFVAAYAQAQLGDALEFRLHKFPKELAADLLHRPKVLALANYSWNLEISSALADWAKRLNPELIVIMGGPNFPVEAEEQSTFFQQHPYLDFYIENEGESGFAAILGALLDNNFDVNAVKKLVETVPNACSVVDGVLLRGPQERVLDVNSIPSPYLTGLLDRFFDAPLVPLFETTRGCPFSCAFCADGRSSKNKITRFEQSRLRLELDYIADRIKNIDELTITDLNFGMYKQDVETAKDIATLQKTRHWPVIIKSSAGKNQPDRVIETASVLGGSWVIGSAVQSTDAEVLSNIRRSNISLDAYRKFIDFANRQSSKAQSYTEVILALPGDTLEKHFASLKSGIDNGVNTLRMYQAILLPGTEMATPDTRRKFGLQTKFRIIPGCFGVYEFGDEQIPVAEIEEIIVGSDVMPFEDYVSCRVMNLLIETFVNNGLFEEALSAISAMGISPFECLAYLHAHEEIRPAEINELIAGFIHETSSDLYSSREEAQNAISTPEIMEQYLAGTLGTNELLGYRAGLYLAFESIARMFETAFLGMLEEKGLLTPGAKDYISELIRYISMKKKNIHLVENVAEAEFSYDFHALNEIGFALDPRSTADYRRPLKLKFFHTEWQREHICNAVKLYENHPGGIARMLQRSNVRIMYRHVEPS